MKIAHLLQSNIFSGAENVVCQIVQMFQNETEFDMVYICPDGPIRDALNERGIEFYPLDRFDLKSIKRAFAEINPDVIHAHDMHASFKAALCLGKRRLICHIHNNSFDSRKRTIKTVLFKYAAKKASHIYWVSDSSYENFYYRNLFSNKSSVLYNILDISKIYAKKELDTNDYKYDVVYLGRLSEPKNPRRLLRVFEKIVNIRPATKLAVIGTGELENDVHDLAEKMCLNSNLFFLGYMTNPYKILADSKAMLLTSLWEGTPMCSLEAMSLGVPIVSTPTDGLCKVIENNVTGYLSDDDDELARLCCRLIDDENLHNSMSEKSKERAVKLMNVNNYVSELKRSYLSCSNS